MVGGYAYDLCFCIHISYFSCTCYSSYLSIRSILYDGFTLSYAFTSYHDSPSWIWIMGVYCTLFCDWNPGGRLYYSQKGSRHTSKEDLVFSCSEKCGATDHYSRSLKPCRLVWRRYSRRSSFWVAWHGQPVLSGNRIFRHTYHYRVDVHIYSHIHRDGVF